MKPLLLLFALFTALLTGCSTVANRIEQKSAVYNSLDAPTQARLKQSVIAIGDTPDMVYIALGRPDQIHSTDTAAGRHQTWCYNFHWQEYEGSRHIGYRREVVFNRFTKSWQVYHEPIRAEFYSEREEEYMRVVFQDRKVTAIEKTK